MISVNRQIKFCHGVPLPWFKGAMGDVQDTERDEAQSDRANTIHENYEAAPQTRREHRSEACFDSVQRMLTPVSNSGHLFCSGVEHGRDDKKAGGDRSLTDTEKKPHSEESTKVRTCCMRAQHH